MDHIGLALTGAVVLLVALRILLVRRARSPITTGPRPVPLPVPVVVCVLRDHNELEQARRRAAELEHLAATSRRTRSERYETECDR